MSEWSHDEIASDLIARIVSGETPPGRHLPAGPILVKRYGVSPGTVQSALNTLKREGVIKTFPGGRKGALVLKVPEPAPDLADISRRLERLERRVFGEQPK